MILYTFSLFLLSEEIAFFEGPFFGLKNSNPSHLVFISWHTPSVSAAYCAKNKGSIL